MLAFNNTSGVGKKRNLTETVLKANKKMAKMQNYKCIICNMSITDFKEKLEV